MSTRWSLSPKSVCLYATSDMLACSLTNFQKCGKVISYFTKELAAVRISLDAIILFDPF